MPGTSRYSSGASVQDVQREYMGKQTGTWDYKAGASGTVTITAGQVLGVLVHATGVGASMTVNGGQSIPIPLVGFAFSPQGNLIGTVANPVVIVFTGTDMYMVEYVY